MLPVNKLLALSLSISTAIVVTTYMSFDSLARGGGHGGGHHSGGHHEHHTGEHREYRDGEHRDVNRVRPGNDFDRQWGHGDRWGGRWGHWGGWARPGHRYGWWGGWNSWGTPIYAPGAYDVVVNPDQVIDEEGTVYPSTKYRYQPEATITNYNWDNTVSRKKNTDSNSDIQENNSDYKLGPDTDILPDGRVATQLTDSSYLLLTGSAIQVMDQDTGKPSMSLYRDPSFVWQITSEIKRQSAGLQNALEKVSPDNKQEIANLQASINTLTSAAQKISDIPNEAPKPLSPPIEGAIEMFASTWMTPDGNYLVIKRPDGSFVYMDNKNVYGDLGNNKLKIHYPEQFKAVAVSYLSNLIQESKDTKESLIDDQDSASSRLQMLEQSLAENKVSAGEFKIDDQEIDTDEAPSSEEKRIAQQIRRTKRRLDVIRKQLTAIPAESDIAAKLKVRLES